MQSEAGKGSTFHFTARFAKPGPPASIESTPNLLAPPAMGRQQAHLPGVSAGAKPGRPPALIKHSWGILCDAGEMYSVELYARVHRAVFVERVRL